MMDTKDTSSEYQSELFEEYSKGGKKPGFLKAHRFMQDRFIIRLSAEKVIFTVASFLSVCIIIFCVGVERGKKIAQNKQQIQIASVVKPQEGAVVIKTPEAETVPKTEEKKPTSETQTLQVEYYAVQVATYSKEALAVKVANQLKAQGFQSYTAASSRNLYVVYVGNYADKNNAASDMKKLKKQFKDCYVKRIKR